MHINLRLSFIFIMMLPCDPSPAASRHPLPVGEGLSSGQSLSHWVEERREAADEMQMRCGLPDDWRSTY